MHHSLRIRGDSCRVSRDDLSRRLGRLDETDLPDSSLGNVGKGFGIAVTVKLACWYWVTPNFVKLKTLNQQRALNSLDNELARAWVMNEGGTPTTYYRCKDDWSGAENLARTIQDAMRALEIKLAEKGWRVVDVKYKVLL